jgi:hypothetical protein
MTFRRQYSTRYEIAISADWRDTYYFNFVNYELTRLLAMFGLPPAPAARHNHLLARRLCSLPLFNRRSIESPIAANPKAGKQALTQESINRCRMHA